VCLQMWTVRWLILTQVFALDIRAEISVDGAVRTDIATQERAELVRQRDQAALSTLSSLAASSSNPLPSAVSWGIDALLLAVLLYLGYAMIWTVYNQDFFGHSVVCTLLGIQHCAETESRHQRLPRLLVGYVITTLLLACFALFTPSPLEEANVQDDARSSTLSILTLSVNVVVLLLLLFLGHAIYRTHRDEDFSGITAVGALFCIKPIDDEVLAQNQTCGTVDEECAKRRAKVFPRLVCAFSVLCLVFSLVVLLTPTPFKDADPLPKHVQEALNTLKKHEAPDTGDANTNKENIFDVMEKHDHPLVLETACHILKQHSLAWGSAVSSKLEAVMTVRDQTWADEEVKKTYRPYLDKDGDNGGLGGFVQLMKALDMDLKEKALKECYYVLLKLTIGPTFHVVTKHNGLPLLLKRMELNKAGTMYKLSQMGEGHMLEKELAKAGALPVVKKVLKEAIATEHAPQDMEAKSVARHACNLLGVFAERAEEPLANPPEDSGEDPEILVGTDLAVEAIWTFGAAAKPDVGMYVSQNCFGALQRMAGACNMEDGQIETAGRGCERRHAPPLQFAEAEGNSARRAAPVEQHDRG